MNNLKHPSAHSTVQMFYALNSTNYQVSTAWLTRLEDPHPKLLSRSGRGAFNSCLFLWLPFSHKGRRGWGMREKRFVSQPALML
jgi:hypothetical protein